MQGVGSVPHPYRHSGEQDAQLGLFLGGVSTQSSPAAPRNSPQVLAPLHMYVLRRALSSALEAGAHVWQQLMTHIAPVCSAGPLLQQEVDKSAVGTICGSDGGPSPAE